ncbi:MAG: AbrB family transcriptional regulator, partial [Clostridiales bacterium]|nr:AbrB family transcriptional regulator [Clostridiales bacterium]
NGDSLEIFVEDNKIILKKYQPACIFCGNADDIAVFKGRNVCPACAKEMSQKI